MSHESHNLSRAVGINQYQSPLRDVLEHWCWIIEQFAVVSIDGQPQPVLTIAQQQWHANNLRRALERIARHRLPRFWHNSCYAHADNSNVDRGQEIVWIYESLCASCGRIWEQANAIEELPDLSSTVPGLDLTIPDYAYRVAQHSDELLDQIALNATTSIGSLPSELAGYIARNAASIWAPVVELAPDGTPVLNHAATGQVVKMVSATSEILNAEPPPSVAWLFTALPQGDDLSLNVALAWERVVVAMYVSHRVESKCNGNQAALTLAQAMAESAMHHRLRNGRFDPWKAWDPELLYQRMLLIEQIISRTGGEGSTLIDTVVQKLQTEYVSVPDYGDIRTGNLDAQTVNSIARRAGQLFIAFAA